MLTVIVLLCYQWPLRETMAQRLKAQALFHGQSLKISVIIINFKICKDFEDSLLDSEIFLMEKRILHDITNPSQSPQPQKLKKK